jgi:ABC-type antimicrobial peptide transport system permease subunit
MAVSSSYFATVGTQLIKGRTFNENEGKGTAPVVVVNQTMARTLWPDSDPFTKCVIINESPCATVIGIVEDVHRNELREQPSMQYYVPLGQESSISGTQLIVRPRGDAESFIPTMRKELFAIEPNAKYFDIDLLSKQLDPQIRPWKLGATLFMAFGCLALLISGIGLFSVIAYGVTQRRTELGIRLALGAHGRNLIALVVRQGVALALAGILIGVLIVLAASSFMEPLLFDTSARDGLTIAAVAGILLATTIAACLLPAMRAGRVDPVDALRAE